MPAEMRFLTGIKPGCERKATDYLEQEDSLKLSLEFS